MRTGRQERTVLFREDVNREGDLERFIANNGYNISMSRGGILYFNKHIKGLNGMIRGYYCPVQGSNYKKDLQDKTSESKLNLDDFTNAMGFTSDSIITQVASCYTSMLFGRRNHLTFAIRDRYGADKVVIIDKQVL